MKGILLHHSIYRYPITYLQKIDWIIQYIECTGIDINYNKPTQLKCVGTCNLYPRTTIRNSFPFYHLDFVGEFKID